MKSIMRLTAIVLSLLITVSCSFGFAWAEDDKEVTNEPVEETYIDEKLEDDSSISAPEEDTGSSMYGEEENDEDSLKQSDDEQASDSEATVSENVQLTKPDTKSLESDENKRTSGSMNDSGSRAEKENGILLEGSDEIIDSGTCGDNLTWTLTGTETDMILTISGIGEMYQYSSSTNNRAPWYGNRSAIKNIIIEEGVVGIGDSAFEDCISLTSITIPDSVTSIGGGAFYGCSGLTSISIPDGITVINSYTFGDCSSLTSITIPDSVTRIGYYSFEGCSNLRSITIPASMTSIGNSTFYGCTGLTSITIPNSVTSISAHAFYGCSNLTNITIPDSVTSIGEGAFYGCSSLPSITIPDSVTSIDVNVFYGCSSLTSIIVPDGITAIYSNTFRYCSSLTSITIPDSVTRIGKYAFYGCSSLTNITIPDSVTNIDTYTFYDCSSLTSITIPDNVTSIDSSAFQNCRNLTSIVIPDSVTYIGSSAFYGCSSLTSITIPDSVTSIGAHAFYGCSGLPDITIPDGITTINSNTFYNCRSLTSITIPDSVTSIGDYAFYGCRNLTSITIPDSVTSIGSSAFHNCMNLKFIYVSNSVTKIGQNAFDNCNSLTIFCAAAGKLSGWNSSWNPDSRPVFFSESRENYDFWNTLDMTQSKIVIPPGITMIPEKSFQNFTNLTSVIIPDSVTNIGSYAFSNCTNLTSVIIPDSVTSIGSYAFSNCASLVAIEFPENLQSVSEGVCSNCTSLKYVYIKYARFANTIHGSNTNSYNTDTFPFKGCNPDLMIFSETTASASYNNGNPKDLVAVATKGDKQYKYYLGCSRDFYDFYKSLSGNERRIDVPDGLGHCNILVFKSFENLVCLSLSLDDNTYTYNNNSVGETMALDYLYLRGSSAQEFSASNEFISSLHAFYCDTGEDAFSSTSNSFYESLNNLGCPAYYGIEQLKDITTLDNYQINGAVYDLVRLTKDITIEDQGYQLVEGNDYKTDFNLDLGSKTVNINITGINCYYGEKVISAPVVLPKAEDVRVSDIGDQKYTGRRIMPEVVVSYNGNTLTKDEDYSIRYENNTDIGTGIIIITLSDNFDGERSISKHFNIVRDNDFSPDSEGYLLEVNAGKSTSTRYKEGDLVSVYDMNDVAYETFVSWRVVSGDLELSSAQKKANPLIFNMPASDVVIQANYSGKSLDEELQEENSRHNSVVSRVSILKANIETYTATANRIKKKYGVEYLLSSSYYNTKANNTASQLSQKQQRLSMLRADTAGGHQVEIRQLEIEIQNLQADYQMYLELKSAAEYQEKADRAQDELNNIDLNAESTTHNTNIANICKRHGVKNSSVAEIKYIRLDKEEYDYTGKDIKPVVTVIDSKGVKLGTDSYTVVYPTDCKSVGEHIITLNLKGNYVGTKEKAFTVVQHNYGNWVVIKEATCSRTGSKRKICKDCGRVKIETIPISHKWNSGKVTQKATTTALGKRQYTCTLCGHQETRSDIPKVAAPTGKVTILNTVANSAKKTNDVIWDKSKVKGATGYIIEWRARGATKWASTKVGNVTRGVTSGLTIGNLYEIRVTPYKAATATTAEVKGTPSDIVYRYFFTTQKIRLASTSKGTFTMSWAKDAKATSYQVLYTINSNGAGAAQNIKTAGASATSITVSDIKVNGNVQKLKSGTTYYVQVREVRTVGGKNYIGNISCPVAVKVK